MYLDDEITRYKFPILNDFSSFENDYLNDFKENDAVWAYHLYNGNYCVYDNLSDTSETLTEIETFYILEE